MIVSHLIAFVVIAVGLVLIAIGWRWRKAERKIGKTAGKKFEAITSVLVQFASYMAITGLTVFCFGLLILWSLHT